MTITIGIPFFNTEATLPDAIRSVFAQSREDWELILVDDGSHDRSLSIAQAIQDPRVRVVCDGKNRGCAHRFNQIIEMAQGQFIARMDADDVMHPERLARQVGLLERSPDLQGVASGAWLIDSQSRVWAQRCTGSRGFSPRDVLVGFGPIHPTVVVRRSWAQDYRYDPAYVRAEDGELWSRTYSIGRFQFAKVPEPLLFYREDDFLTAWKVGVGYRQLRRILRKYGPTLIGRRQTAIELGRFFVKEAVCRGLCAAGQSKRFLKLRTKQSITPDQHEEAAAILETVRRTEVPGLERRPARALPVLLAD